MITWLRNKIENFKRYCAEQDATEGDTHLITQEQWDEDQAERKKYFDGVEKRFWERVQKEYCISEQLKGRK